MTKQNGVLIEPITAIFPAHGTCGVFLPRPGHRPIIDRRMQDVNDSLGRRRDRPAILSGFVRRRLRTVPNVCHWLCQCLSDIRTSNGHWRSQWHTTGVLCLLVAAICSQADRVAAQGYPADDAARHKTVADSFTVQLVAASR